MILFYYYLVQNEVSRSIQKKSLHRNAQRRIEEQQQKVEIGKGRKKLGDTNVIKIERET